MRSFIKRKDVTLSTKAYLITALSYMALDLFYSIIIGLITETIGEQIVIKFSPTIADALIEMGGFAMDDKIMGGAIGVAIAYGLRAPPLVLFSALFAGAFGAEMGSTVGRYISTIFAVEIGKLIYKETRVDIIITPFITILVGFLTGTFIGPPIHALDRKSTRLNSSHVAISYAVFCLRKKTHRRGTNPG